MERQITTSEVAGAAAAAVRNSIYVCVPGSVVAYYPTTQTADVQPMVNDVRLDIDTGAIVFESWSVVKGVPVAWFRGGGITIAGFLEQYDPVVLQAFDLDPTAWRAQGRSNQPVNPSDSRRHGGGYWRCVPTDLTGPIKDVTEATTGLVIGFDGTASEIIITSSTLTVGKAGATVALSGGGPAVGRVGDAVAVSISAIQAGEITSMPGSGPFPITLTGTITAGSSKVSSG